VAVVVLGNQPMVKMVDQAEEAEFLHLVTTQGRVDLEHQDKATMVALITQPHLINQVAVEAVQVL
jgi:hypothetical protein